MIIGPNSLVVSLVRGTNEYKQNHVVNFGENVTICDINSYNLRSVCNHSGNTTKFGHYTANVKQLGTDIWHLCNDESVYSKQKYSVDDAIMMIYQKE